MALVVLVLVIFAHPQLLVQAATPPGIVRGFNGRSMTAEEFRAAKQAHRRDPANNEDPRVTLDLKRNMGYDVVNGKRSDWRPRPPSADKDRSEEERIIGYLDDGRAVTLQQYIQAQKFQKENPSAPEPPELRIAGTSFSSSVSVKDGRPQSRFTRLRNDAPSPSASFVLPPRAGRSGQNGFGVRAGTATAGMGRNPCAGSDFSMQAMYFRGLTFCLGFIIALRRPWAQRRLGCSRDASVTALKSSTSLPAEPPRCQLEVQPDDSVYAELPSFERATARWYGYSAEHREAILREVREHVERCGLLDVVAVDLKHKHFDMSPGQVLLEEQRVEAQESIMKGAPHEEPMVPYTYKYSRGRWLPYEFVGAHCEAAVAGLERVRDHPSFIEEMTKIVQKHEVEDILGFHILHRRHLDGESHGTIETPGRSEGELLVRPYSADLMHESKHTSFQVMWSWPGGGGICFSCRCRHCGAHCVGHRK